MHSLTPLLEERSCFDRNAVPWTLDFNVPKLDIPNDQGVIRNPLDLHGCPSARRSERSIYVCNCCVAGATQET